MFYELMMRNKMKVEEMPLTVVGSPIIVDGVVSGFSDNDYLQSNENILPINTDFEFIINFKFNIKQTITEEICALSFSLRLYNGNLNIRLKENGSGNNRLIISNLSNNVLYWVKIIKNGYIIKPFISTDGINYTQLTDIDLTGITLDNLSTITKFGVTASSSSYFNGSINFNNTYTIKNGTKYIFTIGA